MSVDTAVFIRLMRQVQFAGTVGDAVRHAGDARDVLLIVGARAGDERGLPARHRADRVGQRADRPARPPACGSARRSADPRSRTSRRACATAPWRPARRSRRGFVRGLLPSGSGDRTRPGSDRPRTGLGMSSTGWPPSMPLMLMVACRDPSGTTGIVVTRPNSAGPSSSRTRSSRCDMPSIALMPRYGMLPCAMRPSAITSNQ